MLILHKTNDAHHMKMYPNIFSAIATSNRTHSKKYVLYHKCMRNNSIYIYTYCLDMLSHSVLAALQELFGAYV